MPGPSAWLNGLKKVWWYIRQVSGDAAYENYLRHASRHPCAHGEGTITAQEFYMEEIQRKFSRVSRCC